MFGWDSCRIARMTPGRTCSEMHTQLRVLGAVTMSPDAVNAANESLERALQERKRGVPLEKRRNILWVRCGCSIKLELSF